MEDNEILLTDKANSRTGWKQNPEGVRSNILDVALVEFSQNGLSGGRINEIAAKTRTSKRMIYYYFEDKEGLYRCVLEEAYRKVRRGEEDLLLDNLSPKEALKKLVEFTFEHHRKNPDFIRLVMIENIHHGEHLKQSNLIRSLNKAAISRVEEIYRNGVKEGVFRRGIAPLQIHWQISALSFFNVSNMASFSLLFGDELQTEVGQKKLSADAAETVLRFVSKPVK